MLLILQSLDQFILEFINLSYHSMLLDNIVLLISYMGLIFFWILIALILYFCGNEKGKSVAKRMIIILILVTIVTQLLKIIIMRPRPYTVLSSLVVLATESDYSFPSGHTSISVSMIYLLAKNYDNYYLWIIPILVMLSRLYMGVHYPSDVLGGFLVGLLVAYGGDYCLNLKRIKL
ncbi:MAG: phosphatase PAP2 family protein [Methanosphaera sp.]|nr:phosphatase PAP2 family protein [Methanosphaera sp.]